MRTPLLFFFFLTSLLLNAQTDMIYFVSRPDGSELASIWRMDVNGNNKQNLFFDTYQRSSLTVSESTSRMAYVRFTEMSNTNQAPYAICESDLDGTNEKILWEADNWQNRGISHLDYSPDGEKIVFRYYELSTNRNSDIYELNIEDQTITNLTNDWDTEEWTPKYSPDGKNLLYTHCPTGWFQWPINLYQQDLTSANEVELANEVGFENGINGNGWICSCRIEYPSYSSDGEKIMFARGNYGGIWVLKTDGTETYLNPYTDSINHIQRFPIFAGDTDNILFVRDSTLVLIDDLGNVLSEVYDVGHGGYSYINYISEKIISSIDGTIDQTDVATIFPNPVQTGQRITIETQQPKQLGGVQLVNQLGQLVRVWRDSEDVQIPEVSSGIYFLQLLSENQQVSSVHKIFIVE